MTSSSAYFMHHTRWSTRVLLGVLHVCEFYNTDAMLLLSCHSNTIEYKSAAPKCDILSNTSTVPPFQTRSLLIAHHVPVVIINLPFVSQLRTL